MSDWDVLSLIHGKLIGCSNDAVATFWRVVTWARGPGAKARPGFVNRAQLRHWSGGLSKKRFEEVVIELVDAGKPQHDHGLLDPAEGGWWIHDFQHYGREVDIVAPLAPVPVDPPATPRKAVSEIKSAAGRVGGIRSAQSRLATKQTARPPKQPHEAAAEAGTNPASAAPKQDPGSSFGSGSRSSLEIRENPKEDPLPKDLSGLRAGDVCFEDADFFWKLDLGERAAIVTESRDLAAVYRPHRWDEVRTITKAFVEATGRPRTIVAYDRDTGVQAVVALLAAYDYERLLAIIPKAVTSPWWLERPGRGLSELSLRVVEIAIENDAEAARSEASIQSLIEIGKGGGVRRASPSSPPPILLSGGQA